MQYVNKVISKLNALVKGGFFHIFIGNILVKLIAFFSSIVVVRLVDKTSYAYLTYADNLYNYALAFAGLGMPAAICKYCAVAKSRTEDRAYFYFTLKYGTIFQFIVSCLVIIYANFFDIAFPEAKGIIYALFFYPILSNVLSTVMNYARAHENNRLYSKMAVVQTGLIFVGSVLFVYQWGIVGISGARYIAILVACYLGFGFIKQNFKNVKKISLSSLEIKEFMVMSISLMISNLFTLIIPMNENTLISEIIRNESITANYKVAILIPSQLTFVTQSIIVYYFTIIAKMENKKEVWQLAKKVGIVTTGIIVLISLAGVVFSPFIIRYVYGEAYEDAVQLSNIFWIVYAINASIRILPMNFLPAIGVAKFNAIVSAVTCIIHAISTYLFINRFGIWGAGISAALVYFASAMVYWWYLRGKCLRREG